MTVPTRESGDDALGLFERERINHADLVEFSYHRDAGSPDRSVKIILVSADMKSRMTLTFGGVRQVRMKADNGDWDLRVRSIADDGWESASYRVWEGEGNEGEDVSFFAASLEVAISTALSGG